MTTLSKSAPQPQPLGGVSILSLSLNLPGPVALLRCQKMGASCLKLEPPAPRLHVQAGQGKAPNGDPMSLYSRRAYEALHQDIEVICADLKTEAGQAQLHAALIKTDVLLTSFRPSALLKLGLGWELLSQRYPKLSLVSIVGSPGAQAELPGHDLTYLAANDLITGLELPATLYADMAGALLASEAVLQVVLLQRQTGQGSCMEVALSDAAAHLALPRSWGLSLPGTMIGGGHAGYRVYPCLDGRVALAALEPHFAKSLCELVGLPWRGLEMMLDAQTHQAIASFVAAHTRQSLETLATANDIPLHTLCWAKPSVPSAEGLEGSQRGSIL